MTVLCLALLLLHHKGPVTSFILHVLIPSNLHLNVLLIQRTVEVLGEDIHTVLLGSNPLDSNQAIFFQISQVELATWTCLILALMLTLTLSLAHVSRHVITFYGVASFASGVGVRGSGFGGRGWGRGELRRAALPAPAIFAAGH
jgi:hypothetical protein